MEHGLDLTVTTKHYNWYIKQGKMSQAGALMAVLTGDLWPGERLEEGDTMHKCPHCQRAGYDEVHMLYTCPSLRISRHPMIQKNTTLSRGGQERQLQPTPLLS
eukprot:2707466-Karenia_brevis.AAC.1